MLRPHFTAAALVLAVAMQARAQAPFTLVSGVWHGEFAGNMADATGLGYNQSWSFGAYSVGGSTWIRPESPLPSPAAIQIVHGASLVTGWNDAPPVTFDFRLEHTIEWTTDRLLYRPRVYAFGLRWYGQWWAADSTYIELTLRDAQGTILGHGSDVRGLTLAVPEYIEPGTYFISFVGTGYIIGSGNTQGHARGGGWRYETYIEAPAPAAVIPALGGLALLLRRRR